MSVCFLDKNRENKIKCSYIEGNGITVTAEYDISDEVESINGMKIWSTTTKINNRNIIIADPENHCYILAIDAYYAGNSYRFGSLDDIETTVFKSDSYLKSSSLEDILNVASDTSFTKIRVYSKEITHHYSNSSVTLTKSDDKTIIEMKNKTEPAKALIETNNINEVCIGDFWSYRKNEHTNIDIQISGYIELLLLKKDSIDKCYKYLKELAIYLQLFKPGKFEFDKIQLFIGEKLIDYYIEFDEFSYKKSFSENSVKVSLLDFLSTCYKSIPYRDGKEEIRNILYIMNHRYRGLEDNYLSCFRFIECYYKRTSRLKTSKPIIERALKDYPQDISSYSTLQSTDYIEEIVALRNHYVHSGFYLKNCSLEIKNKEGKIRRVVKDIDGHWLYERTHLLYKVAIDIIFKSMLGYSTYTYK